MRKYLRSFIAGVVFALGASLAALGVHSAYAGAIPYFYGPQDPSQLQAGLNQLVQGVNQSSTFAGTSTVPVLGMLGIQPWLNPYSSTNITTSIIQFVTSSEVLSGSTRLSSTAPAGWIVFYNYSGTPIYVPFVY